MGPFVILALGGAAYYVYEKQKNPAWSPFTRLLSTPVDKVVALEKVKVTSVPTPSPTVALDPHMTTDQVKQVNQTLTSETDPKKIAAHAIALGAIGHDNSAMALAAKANAVGEAKATGARDVDIHLKQIEAAQVAPLEHVPVPIDAPMTACEAQVLLNVLTSRQGHFNVEGVPVPLAVTNAFDADTSHLIRIFQAEVHLPPTGAMDTETAKALRIEVLGSNLSPAGHVVGWWDEHGRWRHRHHHHHHHLPVVEEVIVPEVVEEMAGWGPVAASGWWDEHGRWRHHHHHHHHHPMVEEVIVPEVVEEIAGWGPVAAGTGGPVATGFYGHHPYGHHPYGGWSQPWQHGYRPWHHGWAGWPWHHHHGWYGFVGQRDRDRDREHGRGREHEGRGRDRERGREHEFGRGREHEFGRGRERFEHERFGREPFGMMEEMPMHHRHHPRHLTEEEEQRRWQMQHMHPHHPHHPRHPHHQQMMMQAMQAQAQAQAQASDPMAAQEAAPPAGMPIGGGGGAAAMAAPLTVEPDHTSDAGTDAATATQGWWPMAGDEYSYFPQQGLQLTPRGEFAYYPPHEPSGGAAYWPLTPVGDFGGYGYIGEGGLGGLGGYGSWGSFGGWGHGL